MYSSLNGEGISHEDYQNANNVWKEFKMKTLRDYHELYNMTDVVLLADVFENFRDIFIKTYGLDPALYYTVPGFAWHAALKATNIELELLTDIVMIDMVKAGTRGGI